jgi:RNA polymerase sigma-70 factor (ECF subfamily)
VFVLRDEFDLGYDEIAGAVDKSPAAVRQIAHRARAHVAERRPRGGTSPHETRAALSAFQRAVETGDLQSLLDVLAPDVVVLSDAGGLKQAARKPVVGVDKVARFLAARWDVVGTRTTVEPTQLNGGPALLLRVDGELDGVVTARVEDGVLTGLYFLRNPEKLSHVRLETAVSR